MAKLVSPALSSGEKNLHPPIWGCHHQLDNQNKYPIFNAKIIQLGNQLTGTHPLRIITPSVLENLHYHLKASS